MSGYHDKRFPGEDDAYRRARDELLKAEMDLRKQIERVAARRRELPPGGVAENYTFTSDQGPVKLSELFADGNPSLVIYSFMYAPDWDEPCPMCTAMLDGMNGQAPHVRQRVNFAVVAKAPIEKIRAFAETRGWSGLPLLSSEGNSYNADYFAEDEKGQWPMVNVFHKSGGDIRHTWGSELFLTPPDDGLHNRHVDLIWPLWAVFDMTPDGRGEDWYPALSYD